MKNKNDAERTVKHKIWSVVFFVMVLVPFAASFFVLESPQVARDKKTDAALENAITQLSYSCSSYYSTQNTLPNTLSDLPDARFVIPAGLVIRYEKKGDTSFALCGEFLRSNEEEAKSSPYLVTLVHPAGEYCFPYAAIGKNGMYEPVLEK